jgi:short-subunit dehydrogenase
MSSLQSGVAVITGASSGIGEETARRLDSDGWKLVLVARRAERLERLVGTLRDASFVAVDLTDDDAPAAIRSAIEERHGGRVNLLVNNAGAAWGSTFADGGFENVRQTMALNFDAQLRVTEALLPLLRSSAPASVVNIASVAGRVARPKTGAYSASKAAFAVWTDALHLEEARNDVHVGLVLPGFIRTEGWPQDHIRKNAFGKWLVKKPDIVADAVVRAANGKYEVVVPRFPYRAIVMMRSAFPAFTLKRT